MNHTDEESLSLLMAGLQPQWREEFMNDEWASDNLPYDLTEYSRIKSWWLDSGCLEKTIEFVRSDLGAIYPPILDDRDRSVVPEWEWVDFVSQLYFWFAVGTVNDFLEATDGYCEPPDPAAWDASMRLWWANDGPSRVFAFVTGQSIDIRADLLGKHGPEH